VYWWLFSEYIMYEKEIGIGVGIGVGIGDIVERE
jgi:hypothetical protein